MAENVDRHLNSVMNLEYTFKSSVSETNGKYFFLTKTYPANRKKKKPTKNIFTLETHASSDTMTGNQEEGRG
jgi:hypothetical protein